MKTFSGALVKNNPNSSTLSLPGELVELSEIKRKNQVFAGMRNLFNRFWFFISIFFVFDLIDFRENRFSIFWKPFFSNMNYSKTKTISFHDKKHARIVLIVSKCYEFNVPTVLIIVQEFVWRSVLKLLKTMFAHSICSEADNDIL